MTSPDPSTVHTMSDLRALLVAFGEDPSIVGYADDRNQRRGSGESLLSEREDGTWEWLVDERGTVHRRGVFDTEADILQELAADAVRRSHRRTAADPEQVRRIEATRAARLRHFAQKAADRRTNGR